MSMVGMEADQVQAVVQEEGLQSMQTRTLTGERISHLVEALFLARSGDLALCFCRIFVLRNRLHS